MYQWRNGWVSFFFIGYIIGYYVMVSYMFMVYKVVFSDILFLG